MKHLLMWTALSGLLGLSLPAKTLQAQTCGSYRTFRGSTYYSYPTYSTSYAPTYSAPVTYSTPYVAPVVKKVVEHKDEYHYLKFVAVVPLVELPTYSAVYTPPYAPLSAPGGTHKGGGASGSDPVLKEILDLVKGYDARLKALEAKSPGPLAPKTDTPAKEPSIPDVKQVNQQKCAMCHQRGNEANGGSFILSEKDGSIARLNNEQLGELDEQLSTNKMPKLNAKSKAAGITELNDQEYASWRQEISRQRALNKKKD